jgi:hypothetical protein
MLAWQPPLLQSAYAGTDVLDAGINDTVSTELLYTVRVHIARMGSLDGKGLRRNDLAKHGCAKYCLQAHPADEIWPTICTDRRRGRTNETLQMTHWTIAPSGPVRIACHFPRMLWCGSIE